MPREPAALSQFGSCTDREVSTGIRYFRLVRAEIDVKQLLDEVKERASLWDANTSRQERIAVQRHTNSIFLRSAVRRQDIGINENQECCDTSAAMHFREFLPT